MREWIILGVGGAIGIAIGIIIGDMFSVSRLVGKILAVGCGTLGACTAMGIATMAGWSRGESPS